MRFSAAFVALAAASVQAQTNQYNYTSELDMTIDPNSVSQTERGKSFCLAVDRVKVAVHVLDYVFLDRPMLTTSPLQLLGARARPTLAVFSAMPTLQTTLVQRYVASCRPFSQRTHKGFFNGSPAVFGHRHALITATDDAQVELHLLLQQLGARYSVLQADHAFLHLPGALLAMYHGQCWKCSRPGRLHQQHQASLCNNRPPQEPHFGQWQWRWLLHD